jgi:hypothetical protein
MFVYLTIEGQEKVALGERPNSWHYTVSDTTRDYEGNTDTLLCEVSIPLPSKEFCMAPVLAKLKAKEAEIQAEAYKEMLLVKARRDALLCLTMEPTNV